MGVIGAASHFGLNVFLVCQSFWLFEFCWLCRVIALDVLSLPSFIKYSLDEISS